MTTKRLVHLLVALGLVASALAGTVLPAGAQPPGPEEPGQNAIFFPYIPNGVDIEEGNGPWYGVITVQNLEVFPLDITIFDAAGDEITSAVLNAHASKTFSASSLGIADESAGAVYVTAQFQDLDDPLEAGLCPVVDEGSLLVERGSDGPQDSFTIDPAEPGDTIEVQVVGAQEGDDYTVTTEKTDGTYDVTIDWSPDGAEPGPGVEYQVLWQTRDCPLPRIGGVEKHASVDLSAAGRTSEDTVAVTGYTALPLSDLALSRGLDPDSSLGAVLGETGQWNWAFPIVQTNNGWNSVIHVTNFSDVDNCGVTVIFYESPTGYSDPSIGSFTALLDAGEMADFDLLAAGFPTGVNEWVGQAWVSADCAIAATVDRLKDETNMALTLIPQPRVDEGTYAKYGPLVFENFNGWNTGITMANLSDTEPNTVTVSFYNQAGQLVSSEQRVLQPRAVEYVYRPSTGDVGTGGPVGDLQQVVVTGTAPLAAAADSVKYRGERMEGEGQALSYLLQGGADEGETLSVALIQKGSSLAPSGQFSGDTSGVQLFNTSADTPARVAYQFFDQTGALVAPTLTGPVATTIGALGAATLYTPFFSEMPVGFQGSFVATVIDGGPVAAVSNNVNYDVVGDGTAAYNAIISEGGVGFTLSLDPETETNLVGAEHTVTATLQLGSLPIAGEPILFSVFSLGEPDPAVGAATTNGTGQATFTYSNNAPVVDSIFACADINENNVCDPGEPTAQAFKRWTVEITLAHWDPVEGETIPDPATNDVGVTHSVLATVTGDGGDPVAGVTVLLLVSGANEPDPATAPVDAGTTDADGEVVLDYTGTNAGEDSLIVCADVNLNGQCDPGEPVSNALTKIWQGALPPA